MHYEEKRFEAVKTLFPQPVSGKGLVDSVINKLPFEMHLPGYQYAGPGTHLDLRLAKKIKPKNKLDEAAMYHDIAYSNSKNLVDRHAADKVLQEAAWNRVLAPDASVGEKAMAWLTTNAMRAKRSIGAGIKGKKQNSTTYTKFPVNLDEYETNRIRSAAENKRPIDVNVNLLRTKATVTGEIFLPLTTYQIKKIRKARKANKHTIQLKLSGKQVLHFKQGGFLPVLIAAAPAIAALGSLAGTAYNSYQNKKANDKLIEEKIRHDRALEGKGIYINKKPKALSGDGVRKGSGLYMNKKPKTLGGNVLLQELMQKKKYPFE